MLKQLPPAPPTLETHAGNGRIYRSVYTEHPIGIAIDSDGLKVEQLARQRPTWRVYEGKAEQILRMGIGGDLAIGLLDVDPYGEPWPTIDAFFRSERELADVIGIAVNDGLRQKLKIQAGWQVKSMREAIDRWGNTGLHANYIEICRWKIEQYAALVGYSVTHWTAYHCGAGDDMTHYAAVLSRRKARGKT